MSIRCLFAAMLVVAVMGCTPGLATNGAVAQTPQVTRRGFLGAFFRPEGPPPFGVFSVYSKQEAPDPYPAESTKLFGSSGYCDRVAISGNSISTGYLVDAKKLANIVDLGVRWTRTQVSPFFADESHVSGPGSYVFGELDSAQCALVRHKITPLIALDAGPVQYNSNPEAYSPKTYPKYKTPADFGQWCSVVAKHEAKTFASVTRFSLPGNEVNSNPELFSGGDPQIAAYAQACYHAVKSATPNATVYGFELNADRNADPAGFVGRMYDLGCKLKTCYDAISIHISLRYPIVPDATPCYPQPGGDYGIACIEDVRRAAHAPVHVIVGETAYFVPGNVRDEDEKAKAVVAEFQEFAKQPYIDGVNYANIDECDLYPNGYFKGGCLVDSLDARLPAFFALQHLAAAAY
jgi:hypothetical protein